MYKIILFSILAITSNQLAYKISIENQETGKIQVTESLLEIDLKNPEDSFSNSDEIIDYLKNEKKGYYTLIFKNEIKDKIIKSTILLKENESPLKDLTYNLVLNEKNNLVSINTLKKFVKFDKKSNYVKIERAVENKEKFEFDEIPTKFQENLNVNPGINSNGNEGIPPQPEKEKTFFQKYFWWIIIGGFFIMQLMKIDKNKIQEAYAQADNQRKNR